MATREYPQSLYVEPHRPEIPRNRSNSLPPGLALMNAQEAGILFSAAERATARRRKIKSIDTPTWVNSPVESRSASPAPAMSEAYKPSPLVQVTLAEDEKRQSKSEPASSIRQQAPHGQDNTTAPIVQLARAMTDANPLLQSLPLSPVSPKRQVPTLSLKNYADGLFNFTQNRLSSTLPLVVETPSSPPQCRPPTPPPEELSSSQGTFHMRPFLKSRFSDWSIATESVPQSRRDSVAVTPDELAGGALLSPDSFFTVMDHTPTHNLNRFSGISYASSETYDPLSTDPLPTPPHRPYASIGSGTVKEEISYFTNFDRYLDRHDSGDFIEENEATFENASMSAPEEFAIELTPFDLMQFPSPPDGGLTKRSRANTAVRTISNGISRSRSFIIEHTIHQDSCVPNSAPTTPFQTTEASHWLIGAIG